MACSKTDLSASVNDFTFDIYKHIVSAQPSDNAFMSTTSIMVVMAMLHIGARNNTEKQMAEVLKLGNMDREILLREVERFVGTLKEGSQAVKLKTANRLYPHIQKQILEDYIKIVSQYFSAEVKALDYTAKADESRLEINKWVEEETNNKIKDLLPSGSITSLTAMVVVNAIYFKGNWEEKFNPDVTNKADFHISNKETIQVDMMGKEFETVKYTECEDLACKALELTYIGGELGMVILLPNENEGLSALEKQLSPAILQDLVSKMRARKIVVNLPKFKLEASYEMKDVLSSLGIHDLFDEARADLSGMGQDLFVSQVFHKAFVDVNEEGTEAAAATAGIMMFCSYVPPTTFVADHPFLFMIWDHRLDVPLFIGRLANPNV